jgi:hypothetical protein
MFLMQHFAIGKTRVRTREEREGLRQTGGTKALHFRLDNDPNPQLITPVKLGRREELEL